MVRTRVDLELEPQPLPRERILGQHPVDRLLDHLLRPLGKDFTHRREALVPHVARVTEVPLLLGLFSAQPPLRRVDDHDEIAAVHVRRKSRLVFAANQLRHGAREPAEGDSGRVHHMPVVPDLRRLCGIRLNDPRTRWFSVPIQLCKIGVGKGLGQGTARNVRSPSPFSTAEPGVTVTDSTNTAAGALSSFCIFIASNTMRLVPAATFWPWVAST